MSDIVPDHDPCAPTALCVRSYLRRAYGLLWDHALLLISAHVIIVLIVIAGNYILMSGNVLLGPFILGAYKISLRIVRNENTDLTDLFSGFEYFLPAFVANILIHIFAFAALWAFVVPALLVILTYSTTYFFIFEQNLGFWDAMEASRKMVWENPARWLVLGLVVLLANVIGALCLGVGLLVSLPFGLLLITLAYEDALDARRSLEADGSAAPPDPHQT